MKKDYRSPKTVTGKVAEFATKAACIAPFIPPAIGLNHIPLVGGSIAGKLGEYIEPTVDRIAGKAGEIGDKHPVSINPTRIAKTVVATPVIAVGLAIGIAAPIQFPIFGIGVTALCLSQSHRIWEWTKRK